MKMAQGYITEDGTFFESKLEAELFEAELKLRGRFATLNLRVSADEFLAIVLEIMPQLKGYIDAYEATYTAARNQQAEDEKRKQDEDSKAPEAVESGGHVSSTEADLASLLKLPARRPSHVPDVGRGASTEAVPERGKVDGTGGG
jgi:hypothetical protein